MFFELSMMHLDCAKHLLVKNLLFQGRFNLATHPWDVHDVELSVNPL